MGGTGTGRVTTYRPGGVGISGVYTNETTNDRTGWTSQIIGRDLIIHLTGVGRYGAQLGQITDGIIVSGFWLAPNVPAVPEGDVTVEVAWGHAQFATTTGDTRSLIIPPGLTSRPLDANGNLPTVADILRDHGIVVTAPPVEGTWNTAPNTILWGDGTVAQHPANLSNANMIWNYTPLGQGTHITGWTNLPGRNEDRYRANVLVGRRASAGLNLTVEGDLPERITGAVGYDQFGNNPWSAPIRLAETVPGAWDTGTGMILSQINFNTVTPGVRIAAVQARISQANGNMAGWGGLPYNNRMINIWRDARGTNSLLEFADLHNTYQGFSAGAWNETAVQMGLARIIPGQHNPRTLEIRFRFEIEPGYEANVGREVQIAVSGTALDAIGPNVERTLTVANARDPVTVERTGNVSEAIVSGMMNLLEPTPISNFVLTENYAGALRAGQTIDVVLAGGLGVFDANLSAPVATVAPGTNLRLTGPVPIPNVDIGGVNRVVYRFTVATQTFGDQRGEITFGNMNVAGGFILPSVPYYLSIRGNAIAANADNFPGTLAYHDAAIVFSAFDLDYVHGVGGDDTQIGTPGTGGGVAPPAGPQAPAEYFVSLSRMSQLDGNPAVTTNNGRVYVALRYFANLIGGDVDWVRPNAFINALNASGSNVSATFTEGVGTASVSIAGGEPSDRPVAGVTNIGGRIFVPLNALSQIFGFGLTQEINGTWYVTQ
jgi:hypothetical protein